MKKGQMSLMSASVLHRRYLAFGGKNLVHNYHDIQSNVGRLSITPRDDTDGIELMNITW